MTVRTERWLIAGATIALLAAAPGAFAQNTQETPPAATDAAPTAPAPAPEAAPSTPPPATEGAPAPSAQTPSGTSESPQLPDVEVIQTQPKPETAPPEAKPPKIVTKKKPAAAPVAASKPKPQPQPAPQEAPPTPAFAEQPPTQPELAPLAGGPPAGDTQVKMSPIAGSEIPLVKVPSAVSRVTSEQIEREGTGQVQNVLQKQVPGIILSDTTGGGLRTDVSYRGFDASPVGGRSQALAVYMNGIRINEAFGDTVNLDAIPAIAISDITVVGGNPVFGLNAIGGAISITMKDGFDFQGATIDVMGGSFGRRQISTEAGARSGNFSAYAAGEYLAEDGFRDFSEADVKRMYTDLGFKKDGVELHLSFNGAKSDAGVVAASPVDLLAIDWGRTFTSPQDTEFEVLMPSLRGSVQVTDTLTFSGLTYYRKFKQNVIDGNLSEVDECQEGGPNDGLLCINEDGEEELVEDGLGNPVSASLFDGPLGSIERIGQDAESWGGTMQAVERSRLFDRPNQFLVGVSYDHGKVHYDTSSELGTIGDRFVVDGSGIIVVEPDDLEPRHLTSENTYYGLYFTNTLDVTDALSVTVGGRYNHATIKMDDLTGNFPELDTTNKYDRFNPMAGATYKLGYGLSLYGSYAESNRAPTAAELGCAEPDNPCFIESFLTDDPPLKQVVSKSWEGGIRGEHTSWDGQRLAWSLGYFHTLNTDDILNVAATSTGRGFFLNAGDTLRQGVEAAVGYQNQRLSAYASYAYVDATFETDLILPAPNTPGAEECPVEEEGDEEAFCNFVSSGDSLPGIPKHRFKAGIQYWLTPQWKVGTDLIAASSQFFFGDEANNNPKLGGYTRVDLNTSYDVTENVQIYGLIKNVFDQRYGLYGTFFDTEEATEAAEPQDLTFNDPRSITPSLPFAIYGGVKMRF
ncbi:MAG: TonB-dependent receptor [Hyphomicrobium sp.]|nr:TonB-dependent receptor [Hyphomicrobium sp.]